MAVTRKPGATWVIPSEDEWYKAAYHKNDGVTGNYWDYPMGSSAVPNNGNPGGDTGNSANFYDGGGFTIGGPYWRTPGGYFGLSDSPYGTFDQGGNVWEWNEANIDGLYRGLRGGSFNNNPTNENNNIGFRVSEAPENQAAQACGLNRASEQARPAVPCSGTTRSSRVSVRSPA